MFMRLIAATTLCFVLTLSLAAYANDASSAEHGSPCRYASQGNDNGDPKKFDCNTGTVSYPGQSQEPIVAYGECCYIDNESENIYFVPMKTKAEWQSFKKHPPRGVKIRRCCKGPKDDYLQQGIDAVTVYAQGFWKDKLVALDYLTRGDEYYYLQPESSVFFNDDVGPNPAIASYTQPEVGMVKHVGGGHFIHRLTLKEFLEYAGSQGRHYNDKFQFTYTVANHCKRKTATVYFSINVGSPLVLDLDGDGLTVLSLEESKAVFKISGDGLPKRTAWVGPREGFLVYDRNGNGAVDDVKEMFGNVDGHANGFAHLTTLDSDKSGVIDASDEHFKNLLVWADGDSDGISKTSELIPLKVIASSIKLAAQTDGKSVNNQIISHTSDFTFADGETKGTIYDVWFRFEPVK